MIDLRERRPIDRQPVTWQPVDLPGRGVTWACYRPGPRRARTVVLLHGWIATGPLNWSTAIDVMSDQYSVLALDHRGHGQGIRSDDRFSLEDCADDTVALMDHFGISSAIVLGYSMGGPIAQHVFDRHRHRVDGLVFFSTAADFASMATLPPLIRALETVRPAHRMVPRSLLARTLGPILIPMVPDAGVRRHLLEAMSNHDARMVCEASRTVAGHDGSASVSDIDVPAVVVVTARDQVVRPRFQRDLAGVIDGAVTIEVEDGHMIPFTAPSVTAHVALDACDIVNAQLRWPYRMDRWPRTARRTLARLSSRWSRGQV